MKKLFTFLFLVTAFIAAAKPGFATETSLPSCVAPTGNVIADYNDGTHGIVGNGSKEGRDTVYAYGNGNVLQCLCATDGNGTQTIWLNASNLTNDQIKIYQNQGWIYVPDGTAWGLTEGSYLAQNTSYLCGGASSTVQSSGGDGRTDGRTDGRSDGRSDGASVVQAATGNNSLAATGDSIVVLSVLTFGILLLAVGFAMRLKNK